jgi:hypothetical protein
MKLSDIKFLSAFDAISVGEPYGLKYLAALLRGPDTLTSTQRNKLADLIEGKLKRGRGQPRKRPGSPSLMQMAAWDVEGLKREWREAGRRYRIHEPAIDEIAPQYARYGVTPDMLRNFIRRSKSPRKSRSKLPRLIR